ncbi:MULTISPECIES: hypothetical protein [Pandoraea]|uniref:hypothetical protein n=1 Tax=Pandoraea TaxID=93217 RepID=UPI001F5E1176|nr:MULTISPECIES: hypothetical protein [Pandoraea]
MIRRVRSGVAAGQCFSHMAGPIAMRPGYGIDSRSAQPVRRTPHFFLFSVEEYQQTGLKDFQRFTCVERGRSGGRLHERHFGVEALKSQAGRAGRNGRYNACPIGRISGPTVKETS